MKDRKESASYEQALRGFSEAGQVLVATCPPTNRDIERIYFVGYVAATPSRDGGGNVADETDPGNFLQATWGSEFPVGTTLQWV